MHTHIHATHTHTHTHTPEHMCTRPYTNAAGLFMSPVTRLKKTVSINN